MTYRKDILTVTNRPDGCLIFLNKKYIRLWDILYNGMEENGKIWYNHFVKVYKVSYRPEG